MAQDELSAEAIRQGLPTAFMGQRVLYYPTLVSTMITAKEEAKQGAPEGTLIVAEAQSGGHGRLGRAWVAPPGNLACSLVLYPQAAQLPYLVMAAALALAGAIEAVTGLRPALKWPNDLLLGGRKVSGILVESGTMGGEACYAVVGIGLNINMRAADYPEIEGIATSLSDELGQPVSRLALLREFLVQFERRDMTLSQSTAVWTEWRARLTTLGRAVTVRVGEKTCAGTAEDVAADGGLLLRLADGTQQKFAAGDVTLR